MEISTAIEALNSVTLSKVVSNCVKRWFKDTLKEAKAGDINMQVLVGQMYYSGYEVPRAAQKGRTWMTKASRSRSPVWKVSDKHPDADCNWKISYASYQQWISLLLWFQLMWCSWSWF